MIDIQDLTLKQIHEIQALTSNNTPTEEAPLEVGKAYLIRTVTHIELGRVKAVKGKFVTLEQASWVADTGRYHKAFKEGTLNEVEPYPDVTIVNTDSAINIVPWAHPLPTEPK